MSKSIGFLGISLVALLCLATLVGSAVERPPATAERPNQREVPGEREHLERMSATELLQSLTFDDFAHREGVVQHLQHRNWRTGVELAGIGRDEDSPLRFQARYMLRRIFWSVASKVVSRLVADDSDVRDEARKAFEAMVELYPLDTHHHGGSQKAAIVLEKLGHYDLALKAHRRWEPPQTSCGTCTASIRAERIEGMVRCLRELKRFDKAAELCWSELRNDGGLTPTTQFETALVEIYDAQHNLDQLADELMDLGEGTKNFQTAQEYLEIRHKFHAGDYRQIVPHLTGGSLAHIDTTLKLSRDREWRRIAVAELFGGMREKAVPILAEHLATLGWYNAGWTIYALQLTESEAAVEPILEWAKQQERGSPLRHSGLIGDTLARFPAKSTPGLIPLLAHDEHGHGTISQLGRMGTEAAIEALINHFNGEKFAEEHYGRRKLVQAAYAEHCVGALWRLTGETLGTDRWSDERLLDKGQERWRRWWAKRPEEFEVKTPASWRNPKAAPQLVKALDSPSRYIKRAAFKDLLAMEHPIMARFLQKDNREVAKVWLRFDPRAAIPALIPHANPPGFRIRSLLAPVIVPHLETNRTAWRACRNLDDPDSWRTWWETYKDELKLEPEERWW